MPKRKLTGVIVSNKMEKTIVVKVERIKEHPIYKRRFKVHKNYKAHVEKSADYEIGNKVVIQECKPISKDKTWEVIEKINK